MLAAYRLAVLRATQDVEDAFSGLVKREEQATVLAQGVDSLSRARNASFAAYQKGVVSLIEVLQADESLLRASDERAQAQTESARAAVAAFKALGGYNKALEWMRSAAPVEGYFFQEFGEAGRPANGRAPL